MWYWYWSQEICFQYAQSKHISWKWMELGVFLFADPENARLNPPAASRSGAPRKVSSGQTEVQESRSQLVAARERLVEWGQPRVSPARRTPGGGPGWQLVGFLWLNWTWEGGYRTWYYTFLYNIQASARVMRNEKVFLLEAWLRPPLDISHHIWLVTGGESGFLTFHHPNLQEERCQWHHQRSAWRSDGMLEFPWKSFKIGTPQKNPKNRW